MISGILEIVGNGAAFLRQREASYLASKNDIFVGSKLIQRYGLPDWLGIGWSHALPHLYRQVIASRDVWCVEPSSRGRSGRSAMNRR